MFQTRAHAQITVYLTIIIALSQDLLRDIEVAQFSLSHRAPSGIRKKLPSLDTLLSTKIEGCAISRRNYENFIWIGV